MFIIIFLAKQDMDGERKRKRKKILFFIERYEWLNDDKLNWEDECNNNNI